jgi:hypothetical protein
MGVPTTDVGYTWATTGRGDHEIHKGHLVALGRTKKTLPSPKKEIFYSFLMGFEDDNIFELLFIFWGVTVVCYVIAMCRDSSVGIATRYEQDGLEIESLWGRDFPHPSRPALGPTQPPYTMGASSLSPR